MSDHPLKMKDRLKAKKRPTASCRIFVGDQEEYQKTIRESFSDLYEILKGFSGEMPDHIREGTLEVLKSFNSRQEPYFMRFVFRAMDPVAYEKLAEQDEYKPRPNTDDIAFNYDTFPVRVFRECLIEPVYDTLSDEEWDEFLKNCSQVERRLLLDTGLSANQRNIEPSTPKDLKTLLQS